MKSFPMPMLRGANALAVAREMRPEPNQIGRIVYEVNARSAGVLELHLSGERRVIDTRKGMGYSFPLSRTSGPDYCRAGMEASLCAQRLRDEHARDDAAAARSGARQ